MSTDHEVRGEQQIKMLDGGYIQLIESWGSDKRIIESARMSTDGGFVSWEPYEGHKNGDMGLLDYLYTKRHSTPFEMAGLTIEIKAPIFVFREWHRHRTQSYNEMSARYTPLPDENYYPTVERIMMGADQSNNKQAQSCPGTTLTPDNAVAGLKYLDSLYKQAQEMYRMLLLLGWPKELARLVIPVGRYSKMRASANLRNWLAFMTLRCDNAAQWEIRQYAWEVAQYIERLYPRTYSLWARDFKGLKG